MITMINNYMNDHNMRDCIDFIKSHYSVFKIKELDKVIKRCNDIPSRYKNKDTKFARVLELMEERREMNCWDI